MLKIFKNKIVIVSFLTILLILFACLYESKNDYNTDIEIYDNGNTGYIHKFSNSIIYLEFINTNNNLTGTMYQFLINNLEEKKYNYPITGFISGNEIMLYINNKNYTGNFYNNTINLTWDNFQNGNVEIINLTPGTIKKYNNLVLNLREENNKTIEEIQLNKDISSLENDLINRIEKLKSKSNNLNDTTFSYENINNSLNKVKEAKNIYLNASNEDRDFYYSDIEFYISDVGFYYDDMIYLCDNLKSDMEAVSKLIDSINEDLKKYKNLSGYDFKYKNLNDILKNSKNINKTIKNKADEYIKNGKSILNESYTYK